MTRVTVLSALPHGRGWSPGQHLVDMLVYLLQGERFDVHRKIRHPRLARLRPRWPSARGSEEDHVAICLVPDATLVPHSVAALRRVGPVDRAALVIFDSYWTDPVTRHRRAIDRHFDVVTYMLAQDQAFYEKLFGKRCRWFPRGTDALSGGTADPDRPIDLLRVGRQPPDWEDDSETEAACDALGLRFQGRPEIEGPPRQQVPKLMSGFYGKSKFSVAFSDTAAPSGNRRPGQKHLTSRWTDALASGCTVAGRPPTTDLARIDWPEAFLELPSTNRDETIGLIAEAVADWTPDLARRNHLGALRNLDWRWTIRDLAEALSVRSPILTSELSQLEDKIAELDPDAASRALGG